MSISLLQPGRCDGGKEMMTKEGEEVEEAQSLKVLTTQLKQFAVHNGIISHT